METKKNRSSELELLRGTLLREIDSEGMRLKVCLIATFVLGLVAHGYGLLNFIVNHDALHEFYWSVSKTLKLANGRFLEPILRYLMGEIISLPWMTGLAGLLFIALAAHVISKMFSLDTVWENVLLSGLCVTNVVVSTMVATYIHDFAGDMLALLLASLTAYFWSKMKAGFSWKYTLLGAVCLGISFGFYQAYLAVMITLLCIDTILELMKGTKVWTAVVRLLRAIPMGAVAVVGYFICSSLMRRIMGVQVHQSYDMTGIGKDWDTLVWTVKHAHTYALTDLFVPNYGRTLMAGGVQAVSRKVAGLICLFNGAFLIYIFAVLVAALWKKAVKLPEFLLAVILVLLLPACMMSVSIVSQWFHHLTRYAVYLFPLFPLLMMKCSREQGIWKPKPWQQGVLAAMICVILFSNVQIANTAYVKKDLEQQSTLSTMTRVLDRLEQYEDYVYNESTVLIVGETNRNDRPLQVGAVEHITGMDYNSPITDKMKLKYYFDIVLQYPLNLCPDEKETEIVASEAFKAMPLFPDKGCIATIDGIVVVKMAEESLYY